jgi:putative nucleotidyltransferase with HDIG domain/PAS domain S-box-containing protein
MDDTRRRRRAHNRIMGVAPDLSRYSVLDGLLEGCQILAPDWRYLYVNDAVVVQSRQTREALIGSRMADLFPGIERTPMFAVLRRCMETRAADHIENHFTYPDGTNAWFELRVEPVPEGLFVLSLDITGRKQAERRMGQQIERLRSLRWIDLAILGTTNFRVALTTVVTETTRRLRVDAAVILLSSAGTTRMDAAASVGFANPDIDRLCIRVGERAAGRAALEQRTVVVADAVAAGRDDVAPALLEDGIRGMCAVPLVAKGHLVGVLVVCHRAPLDPDEDWLEFLEALAGQAAMAIDAGQSYERLQRAHLDLELAYDTTIEGWGAALELRDRETAHHTLRVADLTLELARAAGMSEAELVHVRRGALLHDIGKMAVPDAILLKRQTLTDEEVAVMKQHPVHAYELLSPISYLRPALDIPYCHHERWDGNGYPRGLKGQAIPLAARLFAVVDVWDATRSQRPYRESWSDERAREHLRSLAGTHLDPHAVDLFLEVLDGRRPTKSMK